MKVYLVDGTYELFRQYFGQPSRTGTDGDEVGAARGVVLSVLSMIADGATHVAVATDHVIRSFRNDLWLGYKTEAGVPEELLAQFWPLEEALVAAGIPVWPMVELEADDALASAAAIASADDSVDQVLICTPDKDLGQCVVGDRVVQLDRRSGAIRNEAGVWEKFGVGPSSIPDYLALVGDTADGFPGLPGWGARSAATVLAHYGTIEQIPDDGRKWDPALQKVRGIDRLAATLASAREAAELFKVLATLRRDAELFSDVEELRWKGPAPELEKVAERFGDRTLVQRAERLAAR